MSDREVTDEELSAYADGELPPPAAARVARHLRDHPEDADRLHAYLRQDALLRRAYAPVLEEPLPPALRAALRDAGRPRRLRRALIRGAVAAALLALLALVPWQSWQPGQRAEAPRAAAGQHEPSFVAAALRAYRSSGDVLEELSVEGAGIELAELRLDARRAVRAGERRLVESVYRGPGGERLILYEQPAPRAEEPLLQVRERGELHVVEWTAGERRYALVSDRSVSSLTLGGLTRLALRARENLVGQVIAGGPAGLPSETEGSKPSGAGSAAPPVRHRGIPGGLPSESAPARPGSTGSAGPAPAVANGTEM